MHGFPNAPDQAAKNGHKPSKETSFSGGRSYADVAAWKQRTAPIDISYLQQILDRAVTVLVSAVKSHNNAAPDDREARLQLSNLAERATPIIAELRAANAGIAAAAALDPCRSVHAPPSLRHPQNIPSNRQLGHSLGDPKTPSTPPPLPLSTTLWTPIRTLMFQPSDDEVRRWSIAPADFAKRIESVLSERIPHSDSSSARRLVEMARRTSRGDFIVKFLESAWQNVHSLTSMDIPSLGNWRISMSGARKATGSEVSVVFRNIPTSLSTGDLREDFIQSNTSRFAGQDAESLRHNIVRVERLKRRYKQGRNAGQWVDSSSVRFFFSQTLGKTVLQVGGAVLNYHVHDAHPFIPIRRRCARCGILGHVAAFCRNKANCRNCGAQDSHESRDCPHTSDSRELQSADIRDSMMQESQEFSLDQS